MKAFITDITDVAKTRKFWVGILGAVAMAVLEYIAGIEGFAPVIGVLTALGVYQVRNVR